MWHGVGSAAVQRRPTDRDDTGEKTLSLPKRKVLVLIKCMGHGGAERLVVSMMRHRDRDRFDYEVAYVLKDRDTLVPQLRQSGVTVHSLGAVGNQDLRWTLRLRALLAEGDFDVMHSHLPYAATLGRLVASTLPSRRPVLVYTEHSMWNKMALAIKALNRVSIGLDSRLIVVSEACRQSLPRRLRGRAKVVEHGIELEPFRQAGLLRSELRQAVRAELGLGEDDLLVTTVAGLRWPKGYDILLPAARAVLDSGAAVRFVAVGDGPLRADLERQHAALALDDRFAFLGEREDVPRLLAGSDVFVLPSRQEGLPLALMEAVSSGLPIVATDVGGLPNLLTDRVDALLVQAERPEAIAQALLDLVDDPELRLRLSAAALGLAERFDVRRCVGEVESVYDEVVPQSTAQAR
jgi:glycosyltransferase involved in cell wall biosynthesis